MSAILSSMDHDAQCGCPLKILIQSFCMRLVEKVLHSLELCGQAMERWLHAGLNGSTTKRFKLFSRD
jgi:hypothetical protein